MKAVVYHKPKEIRVEDVDDPKIQDPRDAIVRVTSTAICGSDLHIYNGTFPQRSLSASATLGARPRVHGGC